MRLLQICFKDQRDFLDAQFQVSWSPPCREDLLWWARVAQQREGVSLSHSSDSRHQLFLRRLGRRLGGPSGRTPCLGPLVSSSDRSLHQHERAVGSSVRPPGLRTSSGPDGGSVLRQYHHSRLSPSFRLDVLLHSERQGERNPPMGGDQPCPSPALVHHGHVQCHSGHTESPQSGDRVRVDSPSGGS